MFSGTQRYDASLEKFSEQNARIQLRNQKSLLPDPGEEKLSARGLEHANRATTLVGPKRTSHSAIRSHIGRLRASTLLTEGPRYEEHICCRRVNSLLP